MSFRLIVLGMAAILLVSANAGCSHTRPASPWGDFLGGGRADKEFGSSLNVGMPGSAEPSIGDKVKNLFTPATATQDEASTRSLPRVDEKTGSLAQARLLERQREQTAARNAYERYAQQYPDDPTPHHRLGVLAAKRGEYGQAEHHFRTALAMAPPHAELLSDLGYLYYLMDRHAESEAVLCHALSLDRNHKAAHNNLGLVLGIQGRYEEALAEFKKCGTEATANASLAYVMTQRGELEEAKKRYLYALQLDNTLRPAGNAVVQLLDRQRIADQLAANRRDEEMKAAQRAQEHQRRQEALSRMGPNGLGVEIATRDAPPRGAPYDVAPAAYQEPLNYPYPTPGPYQHGPHPGGTASPAVYLPTAPPHLPR